MALQGFVDSSAPTIDADWLNAIDAFYVTLFSEATTAALARTALGVDATGVNLPLAGGTMTGPIDDTLETVASHATTADIWSAGNSINWTGTATTTAFPTATVAGTRRRLICAGACAFTAGASLLIRGIASGTTVTMRQNAFVDVTALSTTTFMLEYGLSGSFTATGTGFTAGVTATWYYNVVNGSVQVQAYSGNVLGGTSNLTTFTVTGFPAEITPANNRLFTSLAITDNGGRLYTGHGVLASTGTMTLYTTAASGAWTASAEKGLTTNQFSYQL